MQKGMKTVEYDVTTQNTEGSLKSKKNGVVTDTVNGEVRLCGARRMIMNPLAMCEKLDRMFGSGAETIVNYMLFESGRDTFNAIIENNPDKGRGELLKMLVDLQPHTGWGFVSLTILRVDPPIVSIVVKNPPVKALKGSQKQMISSYWAGVLSKYLNRQLLSKNQSYDTEKDEFNFTVTT